MSNSHFSGTDVLDQSEEGACTGFGLAAVINLLNAQRSLQSFQDELAQSEGAATSNLARLYKALGGGWKNLEGDLPL